MPNAVELRVHGVGGSSPEALLGVASDKDTALVAGDDDAGFHARSGEPWVEGYVWGGLTSGSIAQTFWIVLLPFTLLNVAGWMYPPAARSRWWPARKASRILLGAMGLVLTLMYLLWLFSLATLVLLDGPLFDFALKRFSPTQRVIMGVAIVAVATVVIYRVSRSRQTQFEAFGGPAGAVDGTRSFVRTLTADQQLADPRLWKDEPPILQLLRLHSIAAALGLVSLCVWVFPRVADSGNVPTLDELFRWSVVAQIAIGLAILLIYLSLERPVGFRYAGPASLAVAAVALATGFFSGSWHLVSKLVQSTDEMATDPFGDLSGVFGATMLAFLLALVAWFVWHACRVPGQMTAMRSEPVPRNHKPAGAQQDGVSDSMFRRVAWVRAFSTSPRHADLLITVGAATFAVVTVATRFADLALPSWLEVVGRSSIYFVVGAIVPFFIYRSRRPDTARRIAILWDVFTFFPRRFHPFAVRPYPERAVPELQGRIMHHAQAKRSVILYGHSQGSVLGLAALAQLCANPTEMGTVAFVTCGSPLVQLYARFFPELFGASELFPSLRSSLAEVPGSPCAGWRNFYRRTDYVGQKLFACTDHGSCDEELPDPAHGPLMDPPDVTTVDPPAPAWVRMTVHSYYFSEPTLREHISVLREVLP